MVDRSSGKRVPDSDEEGDARSGADGRRANPPKFEKKTIALVYDFDGTLSPKPMQEYAFLPQIGADAAAFWAESNALARKTQAERAGPNYARHYLTNVIIRPSSEGATGTQYLIAIDVGEGGKPSTIVHGGRYEDVYVKTPQGWRFKSRVLIPSKLPAAPPSTGAPR